MACESVIALGIGPDCTVVDKLMQNCDILCLQETFLSKQDLGKLNSFNDNFHGAGTSTTDLTMGIVRGRISGGVAQKVGLSDKYH